MAAGRSTWSRPAAVTVAAILALVLAAAAGLSRLTVTADNRVFFSEENPDLQALQRFEDTFTQVHNLVIAVEPLDGRVFTPGLLAVVAELTERAWRLPHASRVDSLTNYQHSRADGDELIVGDLVPAGSVPAPEELAALQGIALAAPAVRGRLLSPAADVTAVVANFRLPEDYTLPVLEIAAAARALAGEIERAHPEVRLHLTGQVMIMATFAEAPFADMALLVPGMLLLILAATALILRSLWGTVAVVGIGLLSALAALGLAGWLGHVLNPATGIAPTIILTLGIADGVHVVSTMLAAMRAGAPRAEAVRAAMRLNRKPILFTGFCTAAGFLALNSANSPPLNQVGNIVGGGVLIAAGLSLSLLPALLTLLPLRPRPGRGPDWTAAFARLADFVLRHRHAMLGGTALLAVGLGLGVLRIELNDMWLHYFDERFEFRRDTDFVQRRLTGVELVEYGLPAGGEGAIADPAYLKAVDRFAAWLRQQPEVANVLAVSDVVRRLNRNMHADDLFFDAIPDSKTLIAQYLLLYELSLPFGLDLTDQIDIGRSATRLSATLQERTTGELPQFVRRAQDWLQANAPQLAAAPPTGISIIFAHISERNIRSMLLGMGLSFLLVSALLVLALRSLRLALLSLLPNLLPPLAGFGLWGWLVGEVNLGAAIVASVTFGIVVDDTVHVLTHYRDARSRGADAAAAIRQAMATSGPAAATTTATLTAGFLLLGLSGFQLNQTMGQLTAVTMVAALLFDWLMLPPLLLLFDRGRGSGSLNTKARSSG